LLDRKIVPNEVGLGLVDDSRAYLDSLRPRELAELLVGGLSTADLPQDFRPAYLALARGQTGAREFLGRRSGRWSRPAR
jgi:arginine deiminase